MQGAKSSHTGRTQRLDRVLTNACFLVVGIAIGTFISPAQSKRSGDPMATSAPLAAIGAAAHEPGLDPSTRRSASARGAASAGGAANAGGAASIAGTVTDALGKPSEGVQVTLTGASRSTTSTGRDGKYEFKGLPEGQYGITFKKAGWLTAAYGQPHPFEPARTVALGAETRSYTADVRLQRGSAVSGRLSNDAGEPLVGATVKLLRMEYDNGRRVLKVLDDRPEQSRSDDMGNFRLYNVPPGEYLLNATVDEAGNSDSPPSSYGPTYFPGVLEPERATPIAVTSNAERKASFAMVRASTVRVSGRLVDANGNGISGGFVRLLKSTERAPVKMTQAKPDGTFSFDVRPASGEYTLAASTGSMRSMSASGGVPASPLSGRLKLSVRDSDLPNLRVVVGKGTTISGQIHVDERPFDGREQIRVFAYPVEFDGALAGSVSAGVDANGRFQLKNVFERSYIFTDATPEQGWQIADVRLDGATVMANGIDVRERHDIDDVQVLMTQHVTEVSGQVVGVKDAPVKDAVVLIFAEEESRWFHSGRAYVQFARVDGAGKYSIRGLPPARYLAVALPSLDVGSATDPNLLKQLRGSASGCVLEKGTKQTLQLRLQQSGAIRPELDFTAARKGPSGNK